MQTFESFLTDCGVSDATALIQFLYSLAGDEKIEDQRPSPEVEKQVDHIFNQLFN